MNRSTFDRYMIEKYNTQPWPGSRTQADIDLQNVFCSKCEPKQPNISSMRKPSTEYYAPISGFRTDFDKQLQAKWCGNCTMEGYCSGNASTFNDPNQNPWSYVNAPY